ncbi:MAG: hypothetical protein ACAI44_24135 [Candidatus Sericytochromatia bacterium]
MRVTTTRAFRQKHIKSYRVSDFESFDDYFFYIHLNPAVRWAHAWGSALGAILLLWGSYLLIADHSFLTLIVATGLYYGVGFLSHYAFDGVFFETGKYDPDASDTPKQAFMQSYRSLIMLIVHTFTGKAIALEKTFVARYPHTLWIFDAALTPYEQSVPQADSLVLSGTPVATRTIERQEEVTGRQGP